jgi:two-component system, chemotaxis family, sensor kinase CheA
MAQDPYKYFRPEAHEILEKFSRGILDLEKGKHGTATIQHLLRLAHTLKGAARVVKQSEIANRAHAIEDALTPMRQSSNPIGREQIDTVLGHLDAIGSQLDLLAPSAEPVALASGKAVVDDAPRTIRTDLSEVDAILDSVVETNALTNGLRTAAQSLQQITHLADLLVSQSSIVAVEAHDRQARARGGRRLVIAEELRRKIGGVERNLGSLLDQMDRELRQLREAAERLRLVSAGNLLTTLERTTRDTARALSKEVNFKGTDGDIRLDARVLDTVQGALVQIVRNAVAHGIESSDERARTGKPAAGVVSLAIRRRDRRIVFSCSDDGRGIDLEAVRRVASQRGLVGPAAPELGSDDIIRVLLRGGISTSKTVTEESGRGIGLDVVRESVEQLGGEVEFRSTPGIGTTFEITIPPSLSSIDALLVQPGGNAGTIAIPLHAVRATRRLEAKEITFSAPGASVRYDEEAISFVPLLSALSGTVWSAKGNWAVVVLAGADGLAAVGVERLLGTAKIVVRPLPQHMVSSPLVVAASLDADGNPRLLLDPDALIAVARHGCATELDTRPTKPTVLVVDDSLTTRMLEQSILESAGYEVDVAASGEEALDRLRSKHYALILVDVEMPGMDGFTFIERIRADTKSRDIPAIVVTSLAEPEYRQRCGEVGAQGYIIKSEFNQAELLSMIKPLMAA